MPPSNRFMSVLVILATIGGACAPASPPAPSIETVIAGTVAAGVAQTASAVFPTSTATQTQTPAPATPTNTPMTTPDLCTAAAKFMEETIPDGTIITPGKTFTKLWRIQNTGTCPWTTDWQWVFLSGDLLGAAVYYPLPNYVAPGDTLEMAIVLSAPDTGGSYRGYWEIQSPWGMLFGDTSSGNAFWVDIVSGVGNPTNAKTPGGYAVTEVRYVDDRACTTANTVWTVTAKINANGPITATFKWHTSIGEEYQGYTLRFKEAGTKTLVLQWALPRTSPKTNNWVQLIGTDPTYKEWSKYPLAKCP